jgi:hypothetical protein
MQTMRRGTVFVEAARTRQGARASKRGSAIETPAARRRVRR